MTNYLVAVSIGPVQGFIAAARRTRDFWMGSTIVSECAKAVARQVVSEFGLAALVFPAPPDVGSLDPINFDAGGREVRSEFDVTNIIVFQASDDRGSPRDLTGELRTIARDRWDVIARQAARHCKDDLSPHWEGQLRDSPIEFYSAWASLSGNTYAEARGLVMAVLAGRKMCRNFEWWEGKRIPKSSLDGARETVLEKTVRRRSALRVKPSEELDLIGVVKRVNWGHDSIRYPSVSRVAIDPWVRGVARAAETNSEIKKAFDAIVSTCEDLNLRRRRERNADFTEDDIPKFPWLRSFPYEGTALYASRHGEIVDDLLERWAVDPGEEEWKIARQKALEDVKPLGERLKELGNLHAFAEPWPYLAVLAADGDGMGRVLSDISATATPSESHRRFSRQQSMFASKARTIINSAEFSGACVFASADDVLAFVAVDRCLALARQLHDTFDEIVGQSARGIGVEPPTLSIGVAIGHFMEPLENLLDYARAAEHRAKNPSIDDARQTPRNGLAIAVHSRGGAPFLVRDNWTHRSATGDIDIDQRIIAWADLDRRGALPSKVAYELRAVARHHENGTEGAIRLDALRVLARKRTRGGGAAAEIAAVRSLVNRVKTAADLHRLSLELLAGQRIAGAMAQAAGVRVSPDTTEGVA